MKNIFSILLLILLMNLNVDVKSQYHFYVSNHDDQIRNIIDNNLDGCNYLIVCPDNPGIRQWADTLARFRNEQGILTKVVNISDVAENKPFPIRDYFKYIYNNWHKAPSAILLFGDYNKDADKGISSFYLNNYHENGIKYLADNRLVDFDDDGLPEVVIARMPAADAQQAELMVKKTINYERHPSENPDYYHKPVTAMGFQESRWFQLCSEVVAGFFEKIGKMPQRHNSIHEGQPDSVWSTAADSDKIISFFGTKGLGYIPDDIEHLDDWSSTAEDLIEAINGGTFLVQHRGHGTYQSWSTPYFSNNEIERLDNAKLTFVMSANCQTGDVSHEENGGDCFAERLLRIEDGAVAVVAASQISYSFVNDIYVWGFYDYIWNEFLPSYGDNNTTFKYPAFANSYGKHFLKQSSWNNNLSQKEFTYDIIHYYGDAFLQLNTEMPQEIDITYPKEILSNSTYFSIQKDKNTRVAFSVDGKLIATSFGEDSIVNIKPFHKEGKIKVVATKQEHYRHEGYINVKSHLDNDELSIYPNPAKDIMFVEGKNIRQIHIYNSSGQRLMEINNSDNSEIISVDCGRLKKGLFHLHVIHEDRRVGKTFVVID